MHAIAWIIDLSAIIGWVDITMQLEIRDMMDDNVCPKEEDGGVIFIARRANVQMPGDSWITQNNAEIHLFKETELTIENGKLIMSSGARIYVQIKSAMKVTNAALVMEEKSMIVDLHSLGEEASSSADAEIYNATIIVNKNVKMSENAVISYGKRSLLIFDHKKIGPKDCNQPYIVLGMESEIRLKESAKLEALYPFSTGVNTTILIEENGKFECMMEATTQIRDKVVVTVGTNAEFLIAFVVTLFESSSVSIMDGAGFGIHHNPSQFIAGRESVTKLQPGSLVYLISGQLTILEKGTLDIGNSSFLLVEDFSKVTVEAGESLMLETGVTVRFQGRINCVLAGYQAFDGGPQTVFTIAPGTAEALARCRQE